MGPTTGTAPSTSATPTAPPPPTIDVGTASSWISRHSEALVWKPITIASIVVVTLVIRTLTLRLIHRIVRKMAERSPGTISAMLESQLWLASERRRQRAHTIGSVLRSVASAVILTTAAMTIIGELNIDLRPLLAGASIVGVAVAFGARNLVTDFLSGMFMILEDQYGVGDVIAADGVTGTVEGVGLRITRIRDIDGVIWYVRNGEIKQIGNKTQGWGRAVVDVPVEVAEDAEQVRELMGRCAAEMACDEIWQEFMLEPAVVAGIEVLDGDAMIIRATVKTKATKQADVAAELRDRVKTAFFEAGVALAADTTDPSPGRRASPPRPRSGGRSDLSDSSDD